MAMSNDKDIILLATAAVHGIVGRYGWNNKAIREMEWGADYPHSLQQVKHLVGMSLIDVLILFVQAGLTDEEATSAIYEAACDRKYSLSKEDENV